MRKTFGTTDYNTGALDSNWGATKVDLFLKLNKEYNALGKQLEAIKNDIKSKMDKENISVLEGTTGSVALTEAHSYSFRNEELIAWAKENNINIVKTVEVVDVDKLESLIYNGLVSPADINKFKVDKVTKRLCVKK